MTTAAGEENNIVSKATFPEGPLPRDIKLSIIDTKIAEVNRTTYVTYIIEYQDYQTETTAIPKRFSEIAALDEKLRTRFPCLPPLPEKTVQRTTDPGFVEKRKQQVLEYLKRLVFRQDVIRSKLILDFFGVAPTKSAPKPTEDPEPVHSAAGAQTVHAGALHEADRLESRDGREINEMRPKEPTEAEKKEAAEKAAKDKAAADAAAAAAAAASSADKPTGDKADSKDLKEVKQAPPKRWIDTIQLQLTLKLPMFAVNNALLVEDRTVVIAAGDKGLLSKMDVAMEGFFAKFKSGKDKDKAKEKEDVDGGTPSHPLGGIYAFRRGDDGAYTKSMSMLFQREITDVAWDASRRWLYLAQDNGVVQIHRPSTDFSNTVKLSHIQLHDGEIVQLLYNHRTDNLISISAKGALTVYNVDSQKVTNRLVYTKAKLGAVQIDPIHLRAFLGTYEKAVILFQLHKPAPVEVKAEAAAPVAAAAGAGAGTDDKKSDTAPAAAAAGTAGAAAAGSSDASASSSSSSSSSLVAAAPSSPPGTKFMGADAPQPKGLTSLVAHKGSVRCLVYCARTNCLVSGSFDNTLAVWQIGAPGEEKSTKFLGMLLGHNSRVKSAAFSADAKYILSGDADGFLVVWDRERLSSVLAIRAHSSAITSIRCTPRGEILTSCLDQTAKMWIMS